MRHKAILAATATTAVALLMVLTVGLGAASAPSSAGSHANLIIDGMGALTGWASAGSTGTATSSVKTICSALPSGAEAGGVYPASKSSAYVEDWANGNLVLCSAGASSVIATVPSGYSSNGYYGLAGVVVKGSLDLLLLSWVLHGGWYCLGASTSGCASTSGFLLPPEFCAEQTYGYCNPDGVIVAKTLGFTYVDVDNLDMVTCTASAGSCANDSASSAFAGYVPLGITQEGSTLYVSDNSCTGNIWSGTTSKMTVLYTEGNSLEAIAFHKKTLYVADDARCGGVAGILNAATGKELPTPFTSSNEIAGLDSDLQFSSWSPGAVYSTK